MAWRRRQPAIGGAGGGDEEDVPTPPNVSLAETASYLTWLSLVLPTAVGGCSLSAVCLDARDKHRKVRDPIACRHIRALAAMPPSDDGRARSACSWGIPRAPAGKTGPRFDGGGREAQLRAESSFLIFGVAFWRLFGSGVFPRLCPLSGQTQSPDRQRCNLSRESCQVSSPVWTLISSLPPWTSHALLFTTAGSVRPSPAPSIPEPAVSKHQAAYRRCQCAAATPMGSSAQEEGFAVGCSGWQSSDGGRGPPRSRREERARSVVDSARDGEAQGLSRLLLVAGCFGPLVPG
jgi:hypothetical protein